VVALDGVVGPAPGDEVAADEHVGDRRLPRDDGVLDGEHRALDRGLGVAVAGARRSRVSACVASRNTRASRSARVSTYVPSTTSAASPEKSRRSTTKRSPG
jgi:hypothetical protein